MRTGGALDRTADLPISVDDLLYRSYNHQPSYKCICAFNLYSAMLQKESEFVSASVCVSVYCIVAH